MMLIKQMFIIVVAMLLTSMIPFFHPYHEPAKVIYQALASF